MVLCYGVREQTYDRNAKEALVDISVITEIHCLESFSMELFMNSTKVKNKKRKEINYIDRDTRFGCVVAKGLRGWMRRC